MQFEQAAIIFRCPEPIVSCNHARETEESGNRSSRYPHRAPESQTRTVWQPRPEQTLRVKHTLRMDNLDARKEEALVVVALSTATLITCFALALGLL